MEFREISDGEWKLIRSLLPPRAKNGRPRINDRQVLNGILYMLVTGCRWMDSLLIMDITQQLLGGLEMNGAGVCGSRYLTP
ncbi:MAG: transposase [Candidatus Methanomethylicia archaeon]